MHQFQPYPVDLLEFNPFTKIGNDWLIITSGDEQKANGMTASWGGLGVLWGKNVAFIFVRESRYTKEFIDNSSTFSCTFFDKKYKNDLKYFGIVSGRQEDKFKTSGLNLDYKDGTPYVDEGNFVVLCKKMAAVPIEEAHFLDPEIKEKWYSGDDTDNFHTMYIGEITDVLAR
ncbi:MAG: flavin reductase family protein [Clostridiales bacterium]|nr:flavin reductase family protein [Clostridiales bacterium]